MSEPLMSVAGQLVGIPAEKYSGINGITVDQNNKTIGLDETVLWSGSYTPINNGTITLNEPASNFEKLAIYIRGHESFIPQYYEYELPPSTTIRAFPLVAFGIPGGNTGIRFNTCKAEFNNDYTVLTFTNCGQKSIEGTSINSGTFNAVVHKIVGINRISGGNA